VKVKTHNPESTRKIVERAYAEAISGTSDSNCATSSCCGSTAEPIANQIGYSKAELDQVAGEVATSSFGCGNPLAFADVEKGQTVIDLGSGAGLDLLLAAESVGPEGRVIGIDMTDAMIETARANITRAGVSNVEIRKGIIEEMPVESGSVDWVISNCVINLSPEKERVFAEIARVLKPGGTMQISDIVMEDAPDWVRERQDLFTSCVGGAISEDQYLQGLRDAGLVNVEVIERVTFGAEQILGFLDSEALPITAADRAALSPDMVKHTAETLAHKVWSAKIRAKKPESGSELR
jgi:SAM-dependent methyltransferase